ncbi:MAG: ribosome biogenesis GTP-binding protein YihA/YsxC [Candidatus Kapaibacterium sp.]
MKQTLKAGFLKGAAAKADFPDSPFPEIAFVGRSNVGKSSLLNFVVRDRSMAKVSATPGKTQQINFFPVESKWMFVDVPGFGYAKVSREEREKWSALVWEYLLHREQLALVCVLVDSRHDPQPIDLQCIEMLEHHGRPYIIVLTKVDKIKASERTEREEQIKHLVSRCSYCRGVVLFSTVEKLGRDHVIGAIKRASDAWGLSSPSETNTTIDQ